DIITIGSAVTYALHVLVSDHYMRKNKDPLILSCQQFLVVGILALSTALVFGLDLLTINRYAVYATLFLALFPTLSAFVIQMFAQKIRSPLRVSLIFALEPVFAAIFAWTIGGEEIIGYRAVGGFFIFIALVISGLPVRLFKKAKKM
ncbi:MAG: EamA family transporter, partial [Calditrichaeota bacterium]